MTRFSRATDLSGRVAIVTGGARGMGLATALLIVEAGGRVVIGDLDREATEAAVGELGDQVWPMLATSLPPESCGARADGD